MTQMVGRALRGEKAGGTAKAYIVSFVDDWNNKIAWINPESLINEGEFPEPKSYEYKKNNFRIISIAKIEEFARLVDETVDTKLLESVDFIKRIPVGMYIFSFIDENNLERNHQILVYDSTKMAYEELILSLPTLFKEYEIEEETIEPAVLYELCNVCQSNYFYDDMTPPYNKKDIEFLLKFFAQKDSEPLFIPIEEIDRKKVDLSYIAKEIVDKNMRRKEQEDYVNKLWDDENSLIKVYYDNKYFYKKQLETEIDKIFNPDEYIVSVSNATPVDRSIDELSLYEIERIYPEYARGLKEGVYAKATDDKGYLCCAKCGKRSTTKALFQIDHIKPMRWGGLSTPENLQLLCRKCNLLKGDKQ